MRRISAIAIGVIMLIPVLVNAQELTEAQAKKWFSKKEWLQGLKLTPQSSIDQKEFARQYQVNKKYWDEAFAFLKNTNLDTLSKGRHPIDGENVYASVTEDPAKDFDKTNWESHRKYVDLQLIISGEEKMGVYPVAKAKITKPYDAARDVANYEAEGEFYVGKPCTFFIFFPINAHRPNITPGGNKVVKKIVIKVRAAESADLTSFPAGASPLGIGKWLAYHFVATPHPNFFRPEPPKYITYPETCTWYGALTFARESGDGKLREQLVKRFDPLFGEQDTLIPEPVHVDLTVFGAVPLELFMQTRDTRYLEIGLKIADNQWAKPIMSNPVGPGSYEYYNKGLSPQTRMWIDDMFMITVVQAQAYRATGDRAYIARAAREMVVYLDSLQKPNGLFYHAPDAPFFWGRGNGWMAAGMSELLRSLPLDNPDRPRIMKGYKLMMESLAKYQAADGMWRQLIDDPGSWPEMSCTGMFTFAMITGVKNGWLDKATYGPVARKGWLALITYINENGDTREVCEGTNKKNDRQYYLDRKRNIGDMHGQAPVLWCATALLRK